jgi:hypothetical protein
MLVRRQVLEAVQQVPLALRPRSIEGRAQDPCRPWSRRGRLLVHNDYTRKLLGGSGGRSIVQELEP